MNKLILLVALCCLIAVTTAQWNNNNNPNNGQFPNFPQIDCNAPGANCETKETVCDSKGNCKEKTTKSGSSLAATTSVVLMTSCGIIVAIKMYLK